MFIFHTLQLNAVLLIGMVLHFFLEITPTTLRWSQTSFFVHVCALKTAAGTNERRVRQSQISVSRFYLYIQHCASRNEEPARQMLRTLQNCIIFIITGTFEIVTGTNEERACSQTYVASYIQNCADWNNGRSCQKPFSSLLIRRILPHKSCQFSPRRKILWRGRPVILCFYIFWVSIFTITSIKFSKIFKKFIIHFGRAMTEPTHRY